ncbi:glutathione S-transferase N-terminal domain-containing protein [Patescibacteria group bacterium]|nr:glutathione S-transferase N-terminal domain-containing protein [Patescibacteria group bacterium]
MILYAKHLCPYCEKVFSFAKAHGITFSQIKYRDEPGVIEELIARGGKRQFPYLVDDDTGVEMYESDEIVKYLGQKYGVSIDGIETVGNICPID